MISSKIRSGNYPPFLVFAISVISLWAARSLV